MNDATPTEHSTRELPTHHGRKAGRLITPVVVLLGAGLGASGLLLTAPKTERQPAERLAPVVAVLPIERAPLERVVEAYGSVVPARELALSPEVGGPVTAVHPMLEPGGIVPAGELLLRIDPAEYELALDGAEAALAEAEAALALEQGRRTVAEREWELFGDELAGSEQGRALALREPQLRQAEARIATATSARDRARLDLARTEIRAPFDVLVMREEVEIGQRIDRQQEVAELVGVDAFWVQASIPLARLSAVLAKPDETADRRARITLQSGLERIAERDGRLVRQLGRVEPGGRMAQVLVAIDDPLGLTSDAPPIPLGSYARVEIHAGPLRDAVRIPRRGLRENDEVWVADEQGRLEVREVEVLWRQGDEIAVTDVFEASDRLIVSPIGTPLPGMELRPRAEDPGS